MKIILSFLVAFFVFLNSAIGIHAIKNPLAVPNNRFGVHILFPEELDQASDLVNSMGGEWGYVTIPIQASDKDLEKWQKFMDDCFKHKIIPIIRIATENYYFDSKVWRKPDGRDILDFANFLNSLDWPIRNRYVVIFNEVNRFDEWGGAVSAEEYSLLLEYAISIFKSKSQDFFIISGGLDNAAEGNSKYFVNQYDFMRDMNHAVPGIFNQVDGLASHSYPNPGFLQPPSVDTTRSIASFRHEREFVARISSKTLPIFITETGWSQTNVREEKISAYFEEAFDRVWNNQYIVAVTPFLLRAGEGPFAKFSLIDKDGMPNLAYKTLQAIPKVKGKPILLEKDNKRQKRHFEKNLILRKDFKDNAYTKRSQATDILHQIAAVKKIFKWLINF